LVRVVKGVRLEDLVRVVKLVRLEDLALR
jgi:hypothetical protein